MSEQLKPCPFCGTSDSWVTERDDFEDPYYRYRVRCQACGAEAGHGYSYEEDESKKQGIYLWNTRPIEDELRDKNDALRTELTAANLKIERLEAELNELKSTEIAVPVEMGCGRDKSAIGIGTNEDGVVNILVLQEIHKSFCCKINFKNTWKVERVK